MRAYNSRKTPKEIYLFAKKGHKLSLTTKELPTLLFGNTIPENGIHSIFQIVRKNKKEFVQAGNLERIIFSKQITKILFNISKDVSITLMIAFFKSYTKSYNFVIDYSKLQRKYFVSRDIEKIIKLLEEKDIIKKQG